MMSPFSTPATQSYSTWRYNLGAYITKLEKERSFFWLIDPCANSELPELIWKLDPGSDAWPLYMNTYRAESMNHGPFMVPYRQSSSLSQWMFTELPLAPLGCLIELEPFSVHAAFEHLQNLTECVNVDGKRSIFRFYDPRILYAISTYNNEDIKQRILGPVLHLNTWEPGRCVPVFMGNGADSGIRSVGLEGYDEDFFEHIWNEVQIHTIIGTLGREPGMALRAMPLPESYNLVEQTHRILAQYGYTDRHSLAYGASFSAYYEMAVWELAVVRQALENRPQQAPLREVLESIDI